MAQVVTLVHVLMILSSVIVVIVSFLQKLLHHHRFSNTGQKDGPCVIRINNQILHENYHLHFVQI